LRSGSISELWDGLGGRGSGRFGLESGAVVPVSLARPAPPTPARLAQRPADVLFAGNCRLFSAQVGIESSKCEECAAQSKKPKTQSACDTFRSNAVSPAVQSSVSMPCAQARSCWVTPEAGAGPGIEKMKMTGVSRLHRRHWIRHRATRVNQRFHRAASAARSWAMLEIHQ